MQPQFNEGIVVLENRRLVNIESGNLDFPRRKSGVRVPSAPPKGMKPRTPRQLRQDSSWSGRVFSMTFVWTTAKDKAKARGQ